MTAQDIFNSTMDLISKRNSNGVIDPSKTAVYKARSLGLITQWQRTMQTYLSEIISPPITDLSQTITVADYISGPSYLAAKLLLIEDPDSAGYFQQEFEENRTTILRRKKAVEIPITDVYGIDYQSSVW